MEPGEQYWGLVDPVWDVINIYDGPEVFLGTFRKAPRPSALLFAAHFCQSEICNGGFRQFFGNSTGVLAPEAIDGFRAIGQFEVAKTVEAAMSMLGAEYMRERTARNKALAEVANERFEALNHQFFELIGTEAGGFDKAADKFASLSAG